MHLQYFKLSNSVSFESKEVLSNNFRGSSFETINYHKDKNPQGLNRLMWCFG